MPEAPSSEASPASHTLALPLAVKRKKSQRTVLCVDKAHTTVPCVFQEINNLLVWKYAYTLIFLFPVSLKKSSMDSTLVTVSTVEYAAALPKQSRMTSV